MNTGNGTTSSSAALEAMPATLVTMTVYKPVLPFWAEAIWSVGVWLPLMLPPSFNGTLLNSH